MANLPQTMRAEAIDRFGSATVLSLHDLPVPEPEDTVRVTPLVQGEEPSCLSCGSLNFQPGARSAWHTHPTGQLLIGTDGSGYVQEWGQPAQKIRYRSSRSSLADTVHS